MPRNAADWLEWLVRASLPVVAVTLIGMYVQSEKQLVMIQAQSKEIADLKADLATVKAVYATKTELEKTMQSVDQKLEIMLLRWQQNVKK